MRKTALMIRCVPRCGFDNTEVRTVDLELPHDADEGTVREALTFFFAARGISDALYDVDVDDNGYFAVVNDEAYASNWGTPLL
jgi:hypothetical protein